MHPLSSDEHLLVFLEAVRALATRLGFDRFAALELDLATREVGFNALRHGGGGRASVRHLDPAEAAFLRVGIEVVVSDDGPGIADVAAALVDGFSTRGSLGIGLGAARRMSDELAIDTGPGAGTRVRLVKWRPAARRDDGGSRSRWSSGR